MISPLTVIVIVLIAVAHLIAGASSLYALTWFTDALDGSAESRRFDAVAAVLIVAWPLTLAWLVLRLAAAPARMIIERRGRP